MCVERVFSALGVYRLQAATCPCQQKHHGECAYNQKLVIDARDVYDPHSGAVVAKCGGPYQFLITQKHLCEGAPS